MRIRLEADGVVAFANLNDTPTTRALSAALPCESRVSTWGDEIYFKIPVQSPLEADAQQVVPAGTVGFWVEGQSLAIIFGQTPVSRSDECRYYTNVNILGMIEGDPTVLRDVADRARVKIESA